MARYRGRSGSRRRRRGRSRTRQSDTYYMSRGGYRL